MTDIETLPADDLERGKYPWHFHADVVEGESDPMVTVFIGPKVYDDITGEVRLVQDTREPLTVRLSGLSDVLVSKTPRELAERQAKQIAAARIERERTFVQPATAVQPHKPEPTE